MITIDDVRYTEDDLSEIAQTQVKRINAIRSEASELQMLLDEKEVLISAYANAISKSAKRSRKVEEEVEEDLDEASSH